MPLAPSCSHRSLTLSRSTGSILLSSGRVAPYYLSRTSRYAAHLSLAPKAHPSKASPDLLWPMHASLRFSQLYHAVSSHVASTLAMGTSREAASWLHVTRRVACRDRMWIGLGSFSRRMGVLTRTRQDLELRSYLLRTIEMS